MSENDSTSNTPADLQLPSAEATSAPPKVVPDLVLPARSLSQESHWPHPNFGWGLLWCLFFWISTQLPGVFVTIVVVLLLSFVAPESHPLDWSNPTDLAKSSAMNVGLAVGQLFAEVLVIGFSCAVIRLVIGRDWRRQIALSRPSLTHTLLVLAGFPFLAVLGNVSYALLRSSQRIPSVSDRNPLNLLDFWTSVFAVLVVFLIAARILFGSGWTRKLAVRPTRPADLLGIALVLPAFVVCTLFVYDWMRHFFQVPNMDNVKLAGMEEMSEVFNKWPLSIAVLAIGLGPGIGEELWCRGFLGRGFIGNYGPLLGVIASSFCFGLIHGDPCQGVMAMLMGLWLHFIYLTTRSLLLPMLVHFLNNTLSILVSRYYVLAILDAKPSDIPAFVYISGALLLTAIVCALLQSRPQLGLSLNGSALKWHPTLAGVECPPQDSGVQIIHPPLSWSALLFVCGAFLLFVSTCAMWFARG